MWRQTTKHTTPWWAVVLVCAGSACGATTSNARSNTSSADPFADGTLGDFSQVSTPELERDMRESPVQATNEPVRTKQESEARPRYPGHLDPGVAERTLHEYEPLIRQCYEQRKAELPKQTGKLTMFLVVRSTGRVVEAHAVRDTIGSDALSKCVAQHLRTVVFAPGPTGGNAQYEYAFLFGQ